MRPFDLWNAVTYGELQITPIARHVLFQLVGQRNGQSGKLFPSTYTLARSTGYSRRSVVSALKELRESGYIKVQHRVGTSNLYDISLPRYEKKKRG